MNKKVLIIGLDGARPDAITAARTPNISALVSQGCYSFAAQTETHTVSGPAWTALLTGTHTDKHGVDGNDDMAKKRLVPTIFKIVKDWNPGIKIVAHSHWAPIITDIIEGGLLDEKSTGPDATMAKHMAKSIRKGNGDLFFIQFDDIDAAGHQHGYSPSSPAYLVKIEETDALIGVVTKEVEKRARIENWLICLVSDHGGTGKSHGAMTLGELTIAFIISGNAVTSKGLIPGDEETSPRIVDVVPTIAKFLGIPPNQNWDGVARGID